jgi:hypothetical protein
MIRFVARLTFVAAIVFAAPSVTQAAGALAIGACGAYGHSYDFPNLGEARKAALAQCGPNCKVVAATRRGCLAFAIDGHKPCGPHGFASGPRLGQAQNEALRSCFNFGGRDCVIRAFVCDSKG